eukprot:366104-Chlamydomonas_euryale.AAC.14
MPDLIQTHLAMPHTGSQRVVLCAALRCGALRCAVLCCAVLCCAVLCCAVLRRSTSNRRAASRVGWPPGGAGPGGGGVLRCIAGRQSSGWATRWGCTSQQLRVGRGDGRMGLLSSSRVRWPPAAAAAAAADRV